MKRTLTAIVEFGENNLSAYIKEVDGIIGVGNSIEDVKASLEESLNLTKEYSEVLPKELDGDIEINYCFDVCSFLNSYCNVLSKAGLETITGINQKQLWHYASGKSKPRKETVNKIADSVHKFAKELVNIEFV